MRSEKKEFVIIIALPKEILGRMTSVAVNNQESGSPFFSGLVKRIKSVFNRIKNVFDEIKNIFTKIKNVFTKIKTIIN